MSKKILFGIPPKNHVLLALDEIQGFQELGYFCKSIVYGRNDQSLSKLNKLVGVIVNAFKIITTLYKLKPDFLYLNSRFEPVASTRDFITIFLIRILYWQKLRIVIKTHGSDISLLSRPSFFEKKVVIPFLIKNVDAWFFLSHEEKEIIHSHSPELAEQSYVTANIVDPSRSVSSSEFRRKFGIDHDKFRFLFVGRVVREKGVFTILKSIPLIEFKDKCEFVFVGDGTDFDELKELAGKLNLSPYVRFTGFVQDEVCDHFYSNTDALVFPTFFNEGFPMALFKSVAAGLPIITTKIRAAKDYLTEPDNVLWVEGESEESVAKAISTLYHNPELRNIMSGNNIETAKKFSRQAVCEDMHKVLSSI